MRKRQNGSLSAPMVYPRDYVGEDWGLWLATHAQHHESTKYILLAQKTKKPSSESEMQFLLNTYCFFAPS